MVVGTVFGSVLFTLSGAIAQFYYYSYRASAA